MKIEINKVYNMDCLDLMREMEKQGIIADWLIADPPYGINVNMSAGVGGADSLKLKKANIPKKNGIKIV